MGWGGVATRFVVSRRNPDGSPEGGLGLRLIGDGDPNVAFAVARHPDGRLVVAGEDGDNASVVRFLPGGELDASFAPGTTSDDLANDPGRLELSYGGSPSTGDDTVRDVLALPDGTIVLAGSSYTPDAQGLAVVTKLSPTGAITGFGNAFVNFTGTGDHANAVARQPDGRLVVAGGVSGGGTTDMAVARIDGDNGQLDASFDGDGKLELDFGLLETVEDVLVQPDGRILLVGWRDNSDQVVPTFNRDIVVVRLNQNGSLDQSFDGDGAVVIDLGGNEDASAAVLQGDGKVVVAGIARLGFGLVRLQPGGTLDSTFGDGGIRTVAFPGGPSKAQGLALQPDGGLVAAGLAAHRHGRRPRPGGLEPRRRGRGRRPRSGRTPAALRWQGGHDRRHAGQGPAQGHAPGRRDRGPGRQRHRQRSGRQRRRLRRPRQGRAQGRPREGPAAGPSRRRPVAGRPRRRPPPGPGRARCPPRRARPPRPLPGRRRPRRAGLRARPGLTQASRPSSSSSAASRADRQPDHRRLVALDPLHEGRPAALDRVAARPVAPLAGGDVALDVRLRQAAGRSRGRRPRAPAHLVA